MSVGNISTIIISILGAIIASIITAKVSQRQHKENNNKEDVKKAIELAEVYEREILPLINGVGALYNSLPEIVSFQSKLNIERKNSKLEFTALEMQRLFTEVEIDKMSKYFSFVGLSDDRFLTARAIMGRTLLNDRMFLSSTKAGEDNGQHKKEFDKILRAQLEIEARYMQNKLLNKLESFSMYFMNEIADEKTVYQSLHQTFISTVLLLYYRIAEVNKDSKDMFYINIVELFNKWNERYVEKERQEQQVASVIYSKVVEKPVGYKK